MAEGRDGHGGVSGHREVLFDASLDERAQRRAHELEARLEDGAGKCERISSGIDAIVSGRWRPTMAPDSLVLDTTSLSSAEQVERVLERCAPVIRGAARRSQADGRDRTVMSGMRPWYRTVLSAVIRPVGRSRWGAGKRPLTAVSWSRRIWLFWIAVAAAPAQTIFWPRRSTDPWIGSSSDR